MTMYSFTQLSQFLSCPRRYKYRYVDGWKEKETRASLLFGRAFETALAALFQRKDAAQTFFEEWSRYQSKNVEYGRGESWRSTFDHGVKLLELFAQEDRVQVTGPKHNLQVRVSKKLSASSEFVGYIDAYGILDGARCLIDWKTTTSRYPDEPVDLISLDPQLTCYSWLTGEPEVAFIVFVRKRIPEIQYMRCTITDQQRQEFDRLVRDTMLQIESGLFLAHPGIRFPQNTCTTCSFTGLCLNNPQLTEAMLLKNGGGDLGWLDELEY